MNRLTQRWQEAMMPSYAVPSLAIERGRGSKVWAADGTEYVDLLAGIAVNSLGHAHPAIVSAVTDQISTLGHSSNLYANLPSIELAERLLDITQATSDGRVFFCNSGAEANETAFKISRKTGRSKIISAHGSFHGRTMGALALTGQAVKQKGFTPLPQGVEYVPYGDVDALAVAIDGDTAAVFLEPILGEGGVIPAPDGYLSTARELTRARGALLVIDEVQTGIGRTGAWFGHQLAGITPDVVTAAKGLGGGLPIGACIALNGSAALLGQGEHASTFGGNPVACAAANAVLDTMMRDDILTHVKTIGTQLRRGIVDRGLGDVRGHGLMLGVVLPRHDAGVLPRHDAGVLPRHDADNVRLGLQERGFLVGTVGVDVIRLTPPLIIGSSEIDAFLHAFEMVLTEGRS